MIQLNKEFFGKYEGLFEVERAIDEFCCQENYPNKLYMTREEYLALERTKFYAEFFGLNEIIPFDLQDATICLAIRHPKSYKECYQFLQGLRAK